MEMMKKLTAWLKKPKYDRKKRDKFTVLTVIMLVIFCLYCFLLFFMLLWSFFSSLKEPWTFLNNIMGFPEKWSFENYAYVFQFASMSRTIGGVPKEIGIWELVLDSVLYAGGGAFFQTLVPCITAYFCARYKYKFSSVIYGIVIVTMIIPIVGSLPSELQLARALNIYDHIWGLWILKANFLGMYFLVFYELFKSMPKAFSEAAMIDGANDVQILVKIALPLAVNVFGIVLLINFITYWNDYQTPMVYLYSHPTISEWLYWTETKSTGDFGDIAIQLAAAFLVLIPVLILFLCFHRKLLGNLSIGGIKG